MNGLCISQKPSVLYKTAGGIENWSNFNTNKTIIYPTEIKSIRLYIYSGISAIKCDKRIQLKVYDANLANFFQLNALSAIL